MAPKLTPLTERVTEAANIVRRLAARSERPELAARIADEAGRWGRTHCLIAIVGPGSSGKTSLLNAVSGAVPQLPAGFPTATVTTLRSGPALRVSVEGGEVVAGDEAVEALARLRHDRPPASVSVDVPAPRLVGATWLVDTPGIGGLDPLAGRRATEAVGVADAAIYVADAGTPISADDLVALRGFDRQVSALAVVFSRIDRVRGWADTVATAERVLADALRNPPRVIGFSSRLAEVAFEPELPDAEVDELITESGLEPLQMFLADTATRVRYVRLRNLIAVILDVAEELSADRRARVAAATDEQAGAAATELAGERRALTELRDEGASWGVGLGDAMARLRDELTADLARALTQAGARLDQLADTWEATSDDFSTRLHDELRLVATEHARRMTSGISEVIAALAERAELCDLRVGTDTPEIPDILGELDDSAAVQTGAPASRVRVVGSLVSMASTSSMLLGMSGGDLGATGLLRIGALGAATIFSGALATSAIRSGRRDRARLELRAETKSCLDQLRSDGPVQMRAYLVAVQRSLERQVRARVRERIAGVEQRITTLQHAQRAEVADRRKAAARAEDELRQLDATRTDLMAVDRSALAATTPST